MKQLLNGFDPRYFSPRMAKQIEKATRVARCRFGTGLFATRKLRKSTVVGYYSGPILTWNNAQKFASEEDYIASGRFVHPESGKEMTYHILIVGPTRYMNHGHCPSHFSGAPPSHHMIANVEMQPEQMTRIGNRYRPIFAFKTIVDVEEGDELLYDYGVHHDGIYYEYLRRAKANDSYRERGRFRRRMSAIEADRYVAWRDDCNGSIGSEWDAKNEFFLELLRAYLNTPDSILHPRKGMIQVSRV